MNKIKVGVAGLGIMGMGIAKNLIQAEFEVIVWNRSSGKYKNIVGAHTVAKTPSELASLSDIFFEVTSDDDSSREVWIGKEGLLKGSTNDSIGIVSSTVSSDWLDELDSIEKNLRIIDAPLTGSRKGAETGNLTLLLGGDEETIAECSEVFEVISAKQFIFGGIGAGTKFKLILNLLQGTHIAAMSQALIQAEQVGLSVDHTANALMSLGSASPAGSLAVEEALSPNPQVQFGLGMVTKDISYANRALPSSELSDAVETLFTKAAEFYSGGYSDVNWTKVYEYIKTQS
jgi:3-hydroxyisobutyrate dehydrogenase